MAGEYGGTGRLHRTQRFEDVGTRRVRGCDLVLDMNPEISVQGVLQEGGKDQAIIRVASVVPFLVMKGMAVEDRLKEKDAWGIYYSVRYFPGGVDAVMSRNVCQFGSFK